MMNKRDRENLNFLINADSDCLKDWFNSTTADDHVYAGELFAKYSKELKVEAVLLSEPDVADTNHAYNYLRNFML